jgi:hypothetical protein
VNELDQARALFVEVLEVCDPTVPLDVDRFVTLLTDIEAWLILTDAQVRRPFRRRLGFAR